MGTLPVIVRNAGHKSDTIGIAQLPQMEIPPARSDSTLSSLEDVSSTSTPMNDSNEATIQATESSDRQSDDQEERSHPHIPTSNIV